MNRADIRQAIYDQIDWQPDTSEQAEDKLNRFIDRAYNQLALEAPFLFFEDKAHFRTQPTVSSDEGLGNDRVHQETDNFKTAGLVWKRLYSIDSVFKKPTGVDVGMVEWDNDPTAYVSAWVPHPWEGRWIEITDTTGRVHRRRIRSLYYVLSGGNTVHTDYIVLDEPLDLKAFAEATSEYTSLKYRIYTQSYYLPSDTIEVRSLRAYDDARREPISLVYAEEAEEQWWDDIQGSSAAGSPRKAFRTEYFQLPAPTKEPLVRSAKSGADWDDTYHQPQGKFRFFYTICWGALDKSRVTVGKAGDVSQQRIPRFESAPSPISEIKGTGHIDGTFLIIDTPDLGAPYGYTTDEPLDKEYKRSGYWKRFYAQRVESETSTSTEAYVEDPEDFFFIGSDSGHSTAFNFTGQLLNFAEPYRMSHGYSGIQLSPMPDAEYDIDVRYLRKPYPLKTDQAVPRIPVEAIDVLIQKALMLVYEAIGNAELSILARTKYHESLVTLSKRYGSLPTGVFRKRLGRSRGQGRRGYRFLVEER